jgi:hypothetical protein
MTDFSYARTVRCSTCGTPFCNVEGKLCDCFKCGECGEYFTGDLKGKIQNTDADYCEFCREEVAGKCDGCGEWFLKDQLLPTKLGIFFCKSCAEDE